MRQSAAKFLRRPGSGHHDDKDGADWGFHFFSLGYLWIRCERTLASNRARLRKFAVTTHHKSSYIGWVTINGDPHINEDLHLYKESRLKREPLPRSWIWRDSSSHLSSRSRNASQDVKRPPGRSTVAISRSHTCEL